jgi:hypothetical protein
MLALLLLSTPAASAQTPGDPLNPPGAPPPDAPAPGAPSASPPEAPGPTVRPEDERKRPGPQEEEPLPRGAVLEEVNGSVRTLDLRTHKVTLDVAGSEVTLGLDRNTLVYLPTGLGAVTDLRPGALVRAARNADHLAYWVQIRGPAQGRLPESTPGQGTGPGGGGPPPAEGESAGAPPPAAGPGGGSPAPSAPAPGGS